MVRFYPLTNERRSYRSDVFFRKETSMSRMSKTCVIVTALLMLSGLSQAGQIIYEGTLSDSEGRPVADGTHFFDFTIFAAERDGSPLWAEAHDNVTVTNGAYEIVLGERTELDLPPGSYWVEVTVDGEVLAPRVKVLINNTDCTITGNLTVDGRIGVGTATPLFPLQIDQNNLAAGIYTGYGSDCPTCYGEFRHARADGLIINSNTGGSWAEIRFQNNGNTNMYLSYDGKLGIGTDAPETQLEVWGDGRFGDWGSPVTIQGADLQVHSASGVGKAFLVTHYGFPSSTAFVIEGGGDVGIGVENPTHLLDVGSSGAYCNGGAWVNGSSREYKSNIKSLTVEQAMETLDALEPTSFTYNDDQDELFLGFIAEDVPELVATKDRKGLATMDIVAVLTKVVQAQQAEIDELHRAIEQLR